MDKSALTGDRELNTEDVEIPGVGVVKVRGLSRFEFLLAQKKYPDDPMKTERFVLAAAMVDPEMTEVDIEAWQKASGPMEINHVATVVNRLSGIGPDADKESYKSVRKPTRAGV